MLLIRYPSSGRTCRLLDNPTPPLSKVDYRQKEGRMVQASFINLQSVFRSDLVLRDDKNFSLARCFVTEPVSWKRALSLFLWVWVCVVWKHFIKNVLKQFFPYAICALLREKNPTTVWEGRSPQEKVNLEWVVWTLNVQKRIKKFSFKKNSYLVLYMYMLFHGLLHTQYTEYSVSHGCSHWVHIVLHLLLHSASWLLVSRKRNSWLLWRVSFEAILQKFRILDIKKIYKKIKIKSDRPFAKLAM